MICSKYSMGSSEACWLASRLEFKGSQIRIPDPSLRTTFRLEKRFNSPLRLRIRLKFALAGEN